MYHDDVLHIILINNLTIIAIINLLLEILVYYNYYFNWDKDYMVIVETKFDSQNLVTRLNRYHSNRSIWQNANKDILILSFFGLLLIVIIYKYTAILLQIKVHNW